MSRTATLPAEGPGVPGCEASAGSPTIADLLVEAAAGLAARTSTARLDAELLLGQVLGRSRAALYAHSEREVGPAQRRRFAALCARRRTGEPLAYLLGRREFWSLDLEVSRHTLIPRPETETLVEAALARIPPDARWRVADLGTGSGALALALASERPGLSLLATDRSPAALKVARRNARALGLGQLRWLCGDWCEPLAPRMFQVIVSNPPYVPAHDPHLASDELAYEPALALTPGADGLAAIRRIAAQARACLRTPGWLLIEHGFDQAAAVRRLLEGLGYTDLDAVRDLDGHARVAIARWGA